MKKFLETLKDMFFLLVHPYKKYKEIIQKPISLRPLVTTVLLLFLSSTASTGYMRIRGRAVIANQDPLILNAEMMNKLQQLLEINFAQLCVSYIIMSLMSILVVAIILNIVTALMKCQISFKQNLVLVSYSWFPMVIANILTTVIMFVSPIEKTLFTNSIYELILQKFIQNATIMNLVKNIDVFYLWTLFLIAAGLQLLCKAKGIKWYIVVFLMFGLPLQFSFF